MNLICTSNSSGGIAPFTQLLRGYLRVAALAAMGLLAGQVLPPASAQLTNFNTLHSFGTVGRRSESPRATVIEGSDGALYGVGADFLPHGGGTVFKVNKDGTGYSVLHRFGSEPGDGASPQAPLLEGSDGDLYGGTTFGSALGNVFGGGVIFKLHKDGSGFTVLHSFAGLGVDAGGIVSGLLEGSDHILYGVAEAPQRSDRGLLFRLNKDGSGYEVLHTFTLSMPELANKPSKPCEGSDGWLYGTATGNPNVVGDILYKIRKDGSGYTVLRYFDPTSGVDSSLSMGVLEGADGALYGTMQRGGTAGGGTIFKIQRDGSGYLILRNFDSAQPDGIAAPGGLRQTRDGWLYGTAYAYFAVPFGFKSVIYRLKPDGSQYSVLQTIPGDAFDRNFSSTPIQGTDGLLYGTTKTGGTLGSGSVFKMAIDGSGYATLLSFQNWSDDADRTASALVENDDHTLFGVSLYGGTNNAGTFFKVNRDGSDYAVLRHFGGATSPGEHPRTLIADSNGNFFGLTQNGGGVFRMDRRGENYTVLSTDSSPYSQPSALLLGKDGLLYGTDLYAGGFAAGAVFRVQTNGASRETLHYFTSLPERNPHLLIQGKDSWLYGAYPHSGPGGIFKLNTNGSGYMLLHAFDYISTGELDVSGLLQASDGWLYGTTVRRGAFNEGSVFKLKTNGMDFTVLHDFSTAQGSGWPRTGLVEGSDGALYGMTSYPFTTIYKINKNGSGWQTLLVLSSASHLVGDLTAPLLRARDGALLGTTYSGGDYQEGTIFRLGHALSLEKASRHAVIGITGISGYTYELQRSSDLSIWKTLKTVCISGSPAPPYDDKKAPAGAAFYRLQVR